MKPSGHSSVRPHELREATAYCAIRPTATLLRGGGPMVFTDGVRDGGGAGGDSVRADAVDQRRQRLGSPDLGRGLSGPLVEQHR